MPPLVRPPTPKMVDRKLALIRRREDAMAGQAPTLSPRRGGPEGRGSALSSALVLELGMGTPLGGYLVTGPSRGLPKEQIDAVMDALSTYDAKLMKAVNRGDPAAQKALETLRSPGSQLGR